MGSKDVNNRTNGLKSNRGDSESISAEDFEIVGQQNLQSMAPRGEIQEQGKNQDAKGSANDYRKYVDKIKEEIRPFQKELERDEKELRRLRSNLIDDSSKKGEETKKSKNAGETDADDKKPDDEKEGDENDQDAHDLQYELHALRFELIKKNDQIDKLKNRIKSVSNVISKCAEKPDSEDCRIQLDKLKKELDVPDETDAGPGSTDNKKPIPINFGTKKFNGPLFLQVYLGSAFHVINAVLVVILLSVYYSQEPFQEKQYISSLTVLAYFTTTLIYGYVNSKMLADGPKVFGNDWTKLLIKHVILFLVCLTLCVILVCFVALRYEDAKTFILNMVYLMFCCLAVNLPLIYAGTKLIENDGIIRRSWNKPTSKKQVPNKKPTSLKKSD